ncbi:MAG: hypothetical protein ICV51_14960 [Flavisolibacter sp.]|nr:hypothetical protein [Flavisolibacter sp.]MBD0376917.1 hypothetical protein [Flavisolibacter sp.]
MKKLLFLSALIVIVFTISSCKKDPHVPPDIQFKTGSGYTSGDATVAKNTAITVGIIAVKTEDELRTYNISYAYDNAATTTTAQTFTISKNEENHYEKDYTFTTRNQTGTERWIFTVTDRDGNIAQKQIVLTIQ